MTVREIPISKIDYGTNVRSERDEDISDLLESIDEHDIIQPLVVTERNGRYEVICGHRRYKALKRLGDCFVPCVVRDDIDGENVTEIQLEENIHRKPMSAYELVEAFERIKGGRKMTNEQLAKRLHKSVAWVSNQYAAVREVDRLYGDNARKRAMTAGRVFAESQRKRKAENSVDMGGYSFTHSGKTVTVRCRDKDVLAKVLGLLGEAV